MVHFLIKISKELYLISLFNLVITLVSIVHQACAPRTIIRKLTSIAVLNVGLCLVGNQTGVMNPVKRMDYADRMNVEQKRNTGLHLPFCDYSKRNSYT